MVLFIAVIFHENYLIDASYNLHSLEISASALNRFKNKLAIDYHVYLEYTSCTELLLLTIRIISVQIIIWPY